MERIKLKKLEEYLQSVDSFEKPKVLLEQYITPPHIASCMLYDIQMKYGDINNKIVGDLGSGTGMLSIGSFLLGAKITIGFEIDKDAVELFTTNVSEMELTAIDCVNCNVLTDISSRWNNSFDTVIMNPPFGTKNNTGIDVKFLETAIRLSNNKVYSLHKTSTRDFISKKAKEFGTSAEVIASLHYNIDAIYKFHKKSSVDINVDLWMFNVGSKII